MINDVIGDMETGGLVKIKGDLQAFLGLNTEEASVAQVVDSLANVGATQVRTPGSGSTSDMEFGAYKRAFPSLATTKEGRILMVKVADANATRNAKLADWTRNAIRNDTFTNEGLAKFDNELGPAIPKDLKNDLNTFLGYDPMSGQEMQKSGFDFSKFDQEAGVTP